MLLQIRLTPTEFILYGALAGLILGFLLGLIPLFLGIKKHNRKYGVYGFIGSIIGGAILGVFLSFPIAAVFTWLILKKPVTANSDDALIVNETPVEVKTDTTENR